MTERGYMPQAKSVEYETPRDLFDALDKEYGPFDCDPCCTAEQYTAKTILARGGEVFIPPPPTYDGRTISGPAIDAGYSSTSYVYYDGLKMGWRRKVYMNPPYGREMPRWIEKAVSEIEVGNAELVVALIPARTDTKMWQQHILREAAYDRIAAPDTLELVRFLPGRLKFSGANGPAPFPAAVVVWRKGTIS